LRNAVPKFCLPLVALFALVAGLSAPALGQEGSGMGAPVGGPSGNFLGPPQGTVGDFLGDWKMTWDGHVDSRCPCHGRLTISVGERGDLVGYWDTKEGSVVLRGSVGYNQDVWTGRFDQPDSDADFPLRGNFRLEARGEGAALSGSYQPQGTTLPFRLSGTR
jgi:hypothetical protein